VYIYLKLNNIKEKWFSVSNFRLSFGKKINLGLTLGSKTFLFGLSSGSCISLSSLPPQRYYPTAHEDAVCDPARRDLDFGARAPLESDSFGAHF